MSLSSFDAAVRNFKFKGKDRESFPTINFKILKNLRFTASEGYTFSRFYLIFLEQIPPDDNVMNILFIFIKIIQILVSHYFSPSTIVFLENLIIIFLDLCQKYEDQLSISIKFHHLFHYLKNDI